METKQDKKKRVIKTLIFVIFFTLFGAVAVSQTPTTEIAWVCVVLTLTIFLFVSEILPIDVAAICIMVLLGLTSLLYPYMGLSEALIPQSDLFNGFKSNAVISIIAVMIIGAGLDITGLMSVVASFIMKLGGSKESRVITVISSSVGLISSFMQNVGAAALFLPVVGRISSRTGIPISKLLMPMGFCAILGGTVTLVGSSPLILLNDLIITSNESLPDAQKMETFGLFSVTPFGLVMVAVGIIYFIVLGKFILPKTSLQKNNANKSFEYYKKTYGLNYEMVEVNITENSEIIGRTLGSFESKYNIRTVALMTEGISHIGIGHLPLYQKISTNDTVVFIGEIEDINNFVEKFDLERKDEITQFANAINPTQAGLAEAVIHPSSPLVGSTAIEFRLRSKFGASVIAIIRNNTIITIGQDVRNVNFQAGDTILLFSVWQDLAEFDKVKDMVVVTSDYPHEVVRPHKVIVALLSLFAALGLVLFTDLALSVSLLVGALGMILGNVLNIEEAYKAVSWKTVFLLASLIPLGVAVEQSGTAKWIADLTLSALDGVPSWGLLLAVAVLSTLFTLVMSNVGATVLLVPLAVKIAIGAEEDPAIFAMTVALATSNSFLIPTHQVNALIMGPGGYAVKDFIKAGGIMTAIFLAILVIMVPMIF